MLVWLVQPSAASLTMMAWRRCCCCGGSTLCKVLAVTYNLAAITGIIIISIILIISIIISSSDASQIEVHHKLIQTVVYLPIYLQGGKSVEGEVGVECVRHDRLHLFLAGVPL